LIEAHASVLAGWWFCGYRCIKQLKGIYPTEVSLAIKRGLRLHETLSRRTRSPEAQRLADTLDKYKVASETRPNDGTFFTRPFKDFQVLGDVDGFNLRADGFQIVEYKTISNPEWLRRAWYLSPQIFQEQLYAWLLEPTLHDLDMPLTRDHVIIHYDGKGVEQGRTRVTYDPSQVYANLFTIHGAYEDPARIIYSTIPWKCDHCDPVYKSTCSHPVKLKHV